ncbi:hypothetical protein ACIRPK_07300 [Kitasatospora sp. NPDC101801]|uniref:hypothetical protein n=1 Tax=Kitasatospora sp. NPDC101801 TaxID=3364103 RepID=UPI0037FA9763
MVAATDHTFDVFIAGAPAHSAAERAVRRRLHELGVRTEVVDRETSLAFHIGQMDRCRNFLLLATAESAGSHDVREQVDYWRDHRGMRKSFYILDVSGDTVRSGGWHHLVDFPPFGPGDRPAGIWSPSALDHPDHAKRLADVLTAERAPLPPNGGPTTATRRTRALLGVFLLALVAIAWISTRSLLESHQQSGLGPTDAPAAVASVVSIGTTIGVLIGGVLTGLAKLIQARGQRDADLVRANAELVRAEADMVRARAALPPGDTPTPPAPLPPSETEPPADPPTSY